MSYRRSILLPIIVLTLWQLMVFYYQIENYLLPSPANIFMAFMHHFKELLLHGITTTYEMLLGFSCGIAAGCLAGYATARFKTAEHWLRPLLITSQNIPTFAIAPFIIIWVGYGISSKVIISTLMIFFPVASAFYDGLTNTPHNWLALAKNHHTSQWRLFLQIKLPASLPKLASGIRIAAVMAPIGTIIGEWVGASHGLGYIMITANAQLQTDLMMAALLLIMALSLLLYYTVDYLLNKTIWWTVYA